MNIVELPLVILCLAVLSVPLAARLRIPFEIFLLVTSCLISLMPGLPEIEIKPYVVFYLFLPPILFSAGHFISWNQFKLNRTLIFLLAFGLVIATAAIIACVVTTLIPGMSLAEGFLLGSIISPTDASAATTLIKKLGAPRRLIAILEGESLINDATALIFFRFSLIAMATGVFSFPNALATLFILTSGGVFIGLIIGVGGVFIIKRLNDVSAETTFTFVIAFGCYIIAEHLGASGVIATVTGGICGGLMMPEHGRTLTRLNARASWNTILFVINVLAFTLIGLELSPVIKNLAEYDLLNLIQEGAILSLVVIIVRMLWVFLMAYLPRSITRFKEERRAQLTPTMLFILGWSGMRGIVSLAAVLAIPKYIAPNVLLPNRDMLIFLVYCVIVITLVLPTLTLPMLLKFFKLENAENLLREEAVARMRSLEGVIENVSGLAKKENVPTKVYNDFLKQIERRINIIRTQLTDTPYSTLPVDYFSMRKLILTAIKSERATLIQLRRKGEIHDDLFRKLANELDIEEVRANTLRL